MATINYLQSAVRQFQYYKLLGERAIAQLQDADLLWKPDPEANSIAIIIKHMRGNMLSRWTDFLTTDGEKPDRERDSEFVEFTGGRESLMYAWEEGWECLFHALESITDDDLERIIYIRNEGHSVLEAINRQLAHYPYHVGQMVFIARMLRQDDWQSLSIPKHKSGNYNEEKFAQEKGRRHFTDDLLK